MHLEPKTSQSEPATTSSALSSQSPEQHSKNPGTDSTLPEKAKYLQELEAAPLGSWFLFTSPEGQKRRAKLSIRIAGGGNYVFVNRAGVKVLEKPLSTLVEEMREGRVKVLDSELILDRALESALESLRQMHDSLS